MPSIFHVGERFAAMIPEVVDRYRRNLLDASNPLGTSPELWAESSVHATLMLESYARVLDRSAEPMTARDLEEDLLASSAVGGLWACCKARLTDSLSAMQALENITLEVLVDLLADAPEGRRAEMIAGSALAIGQIGSLHAQTAARSYDAFLLQQIEQVNSDDRSRLARDIHDRLGNGLALAFRHFELYRKQMPDVGAAGEKHLAAIQDSLEEATSFTRGLVSGLRAVAPLTNLAEAISDCAAALNFRDIPFWVSVHGDETWIPEHHRDELFLIVREFLRNSFAHAEPDSIVIRIRISPGRVDVEAFDDGLGFVPDRQRWVNERAMPSGRSRGAGLLVMQERTEKLGGQFSLLTRPGKGTRIRLWILLPQRPETDEKAAPNGSGSAAP